MTHQTAVDDSSGTGRTRDQTIKLITTGRKSGLPHVAVVRFALDSGSYAVISGSPRADWYLNALHQGTAKVRLGEYVQTVACEASLDPTGPRRLFEAKYGRRVVKEWYSSQATRPLRLTPTSPLVLRGAARGEGQTKLDYAAWKAQGLDYLEAVSGAFDSASEEYDHSIGSNFINVFTRERSIREVLRRVRPDEVVLEIGCGTGTEAIRISKHVKTVVATDVSPAMVSLVRRKVEARRLQGKVEALRLGAVEIGDARNHLPEGRVRVAYSFNGALNCELQIGRFPRELWDLMEPEGVFVCSVRTDFCLEESLFRAGRLKFGKLAPRKRQPIMVSVGGQDIPAYYYNPGRFARLFAPYFRVEKIVGLPAVVPPPSMNDIYVKLRSILSPLELAEAALADRFPFNRWGDQALFVFNRNDVRGGHP